MKRLVLLSLFLSLGTTYTFGQIKIGDNPQTIDPASVLELESNSRVLVISKVTTAQMEAITPLPGGMVYNTDIECIHYYNGAQWINLCDAANITFSTNNIVNNPEAPTETIVITQEGSNYNFEIAPGNIRTVHIANSAVGPNQIANNSIGEDKLAPDSVGESELRDNTVGSDEIKDRSITSFDIAESDPNFVMATDENGIPIWKNQNELFDLTFNKADTTLTITPSTTPGGGSVNLGGLIGSDDQQLTLQNNILRLEDGGLDIDLNSFTTDTELNTALVLKEDNANKSDNVALGSSTTLYPTQNAVKVYVDNAVGGVGGTGDITSGDINITGGTDAAFNDVSLTIANNAINSTKIANATILAEDLNQMGASNGQILKWNGADWAPSADAGGTTYTEGAGLSLSPANQFSVNPLAGDVSGPTNATVIGANTVNSAKIANATILAEDLNQMGASNGQILKWNGADWAPSADAGGTTYTEGAGLSLSPANQFSVNPLAGDVSGPTNATVIGANTVNSAKIANATILAEDLNQMGALDGQILKWEDDVNNWIIADDRTDGTGISALTDGTILIGDATNIPQERTLIGDATIDNTGVLTIALDAVSSAEIALNTIVADDIATGAVTSDEILDDNVTPDKIQQGTDGQVLITNGTDVQWGSAPAGASVTGTTIDGDGTTGNALELADDAVTTIKILDDNVTPDKIQQGTDGQVLITNGTDVQWGSAPAGASVTGTTIDGDGTTGNALELADDAVTTIKILDDNVTPDKIQQGTDGQVLITNGTDVQWGNLTNPANTGAILFSDGNGGVNENVAQLNWDGNSLGIGVATPTAQLQVANQIRAGSFSGPDTGGSAALPTYRFNSTTKNDGMFQPDEDEIAFSAGGNEGLRILGSGNVGIGVTVPQENLHVAGNIRADGSFLSNDNAIGVPDYVFQKYFLGVSALNSDYQFQSLKEIESFIKKNNHLPGITSAAAAKKEGAWNLSKSNLQNLEKIEELFLHTIEQEKKIETLQQENQELSKELESLKSQVEEIKKMLAKENE
ncbi:hypothetical protein PP182_15945 [Maribacter sp. PR1]|uniref:Peptidase S74 domain-containing protein n=1 Tax=Maribacter cobaltidurans TaxID=1178778 RepID=A0ABU7IXP5_9FLAO|nr:MULTISPECIES: hypothetical protein [Maribacter]MDC6390186.1 hypothetical protein [Maribacter sp. PR1]MEE1977576.1 hypothetical protein [Maribacter cobaltidurans]